MKGKEQQDYNPLEGSADRIDGLVKLAVGRIDRPDVVRGSAKRMLVEKNIFLSELAQKREERTDA